jgi:hypothetical protein
MCMTLDVLWKIKGANKLDINRRVLLGSLVKERSFSNWMKVVSVGIFSWYSPPSINVTLINVNLLYLLTKSYSPHTAN